MTFNAVRKVALALEGVEESTWYGTAAFKLNGAGIARLKEDGKSLVVRVDFEQRRELMEADPETYYITDHYLNYPAVLVCLSRVDAAAMRDLLRGACRFVAGEQRKRRAK